MKVRIGTDALEIEDRVFYGLFENSIASTYADFEKAESRGYIGFGTLKKLAKKGEIPLPLFFSPFSFVENQIKFKNTNLLSGFTKEHVSINSRGDVQLRDIDLILKDLIRKQMLLKKLDASLKKNSFVGLIKRRGNSLNADARKVLTALDLEEGSLSQCSSPEKALNLYIQHLESHQVLVSQSVNNWMPQKLKNKHFSGMTVKDAKIPYIFLARGNFGDYQDPMGRQLFTLVLLSIFVATGTFAPVEYDGISLEKSDSYEYDLASTILMPEDQLLQMDSNSLESIRATAKNLNVTPSALIVRLSRNNMLDDLSAKEYLKILSDEFRRSSESKPRSPSPATAITKYNGNEMVTKMIQFLDAKKITSAEFRKAICGNKVKTTDIPELRARILER